MAGDPGASGPGGGRIGAYELLDLLGAGGMGEVYRARDGRLPRDVALKLLPEEFTQDADRVARFEREARLLASLNHPNIAVVHGVEQAGGQQALVMELVEGEDLSRLIAARGALKLEEAVGIARQIADAVEAAHEKGVIHRDLKPANVKVRPDGVVKVLDFGLAKALPRAGGTGRLASQAPTLSIEGTAQGGVVLGTAAYMSPEQARGQVVDERTDIWAFGCVLYEMLTGRAAFARDSMTDTLAAILDQDPDWSHLPTELPKALRRLLERCLAKDVRRRLRSIADARFDLDDARARDEVEATPASGTASKWRAATVVLAAATLAAGALALWSLRRPDGASREIVRYSVEAPPGDHFELAAGLPPALALSPDGTELVYSSRSQNGNQLYRRGRDELESAPIQGTDGGFGPFFSPDGQWVGFITGGSIRKVPLAGGAPQTISAAVNIIGAAWGQDDTIVWGQWDGGLFTVSADGGRSEPLTTLATERGETRHASPVFSPDGRHLFFAAFHDAAPASVEVLELATGRRQTIAPGERAHLSEGHLVFSRGRDLFVARFNAENLALEEPAVRVLEGISAGGQSQFAVAADGTLAYAPAASDQLRLVWVDRNGGTSPALAEGRRFSHPRISPDGTRVLVQVRSDAGANEFWIYDLARGAQDRLNATGSRPIWEADGARVTFQSAGSLYSTRADGSEPPELLVRREPPASALFPLAWSANGQVLVFSRPAPETNRDVFTMRRGDAPAPFVATPRDERAAMLSPDALWMVYGAREVGREEEIYVQPFPDGDGRILVSAGGGVEPVWSPDGREIFYRSTDGRTLHAVDVTTDPRFQVKAPRALFEGNFPLGSSFWSDYDVTRDGQRFLMLESEDESTARVNVVVHWIDSLGPS